MGVGGRRGLGRAAAISALLAVGLQGAACASPGVVEAGGGFAHPARGWRIDAPGAGWTRASVEGAELAFRGPGGAWMSLASRCGIVRKEPRVLVRHLAIGLPGRSLVREGEVRVDGRPGWSQTWRTRAGGAERELEAVSVVADDCVYDFVLVARPGAAGAQQGFERWCGSFRLPPPPPELGGAP
jgi:hypothetical protein